MYCPDCTYEMWQILFPSNNGICLWDYCTYCGIWARVME